MFLTAFTGLRLASTIDCTESAMYLGARPMWNVVVMEYGSVTRARSYKFSETVVVYASV